MKSFYFKRFALCLSIIIGTALTSFAQNVAKIGDTEYATLAEAVAAAGEGATVTLLSSTDVSEMIPVTKSITLDLNGQTITNNVTANRLFRISDVTFTIEGNKGNIITPSTNTQSYGFVDFRDATGVAGASTKLIANNVSFEGGTNEGSLFAFRGNGQSIEFNNVDVNLTESYTYSIINGYQMSVSINIQGGSFICKSTHKTAGVFQAGSNSTINFSNVNVETCVGPIFQINANSVAVFENCTMKNTATDSYFATCIASAYGSEVNVKGGSYEANYAIYVYNSGGTINLDGGTYIGNIASVQVDRAYESDPPAIVNVSSGIFTGDVKNNGLNSEVNILDGTINGSIVNSGNTSSTTISGGTITGDVKATGTNATITITDGEVTGILSNTGNGSSISVTGGTFTNTNSNVTQYIDPNNTTSTDENGKTVVKSYVAQVGENKYLTLAEAFSNANDGETITLLYNVDDFGSISFSGKSLTLDLNGQTATGEEVNVGQNGALDIEDKTATVAPVIYENHKVTYAAGSLNVSNEVNAVSGGSVTLKSGKIISKYIGLYAAGDKNGLAEVKSTVTLAGGYVEAQEFAISPQGKGATANIAGGVALAKDNAVVGGNGTINLGGTYINITGGTLIGNIQTAGYVACGVYHPQSGELNISGGTIYADGGTGILMRGGTLKVTGGTIVASGDESLLGKVGDSRVVVGTSGIVFDRDAKYYDAPNVNIEISGTPSISGTVSAITVINTENIEDANDAITIKGGTFNSDVTDYCVDGFVPVKGEDGTYTVETGDVYIAYKENSGLKSGFVSLTGDEKVAELELNQATITKLIVNNDFENVPLKYTRDYTAGYWTDLFVPFDIELTSGLLQDFSFARLWDTELDENNNVTIECIMMKEGDKVSANTPYIIRANKGGIQPITFTGASLKKTADVSGSLVADCSSIEQTFKFYGVYENTTLLDKYGYYLNPSEKSSFYTVSKATACVTPMRFYMTVQNKADGSYYYPNETNEGTPKSVKLKVIGGGEGTTGITEINTATTQGEQSVYTLQGTFVGRSTKGLKAGIYIVNGKKVIIK